MLCESILTLWLGTAAAQQPLEQFVRAGDQAALDGRIAEQDLREARGNRIGAAGALLPRLSATGGYTRNQQAIVATFPGADGTLQDATITAKDQLDATVRVELALLDVPAWSRYLGAEATLRAADARLDAVRSDVAGAVVSAWYRLVAARAVLESSGTTRATAEENLAVVTSRSSAGLASELDLERARADLARTEQQVAEADLEVAVASRQLFLLTQLEPTSDPVELTDARSEEPPLDVWMARADRVPTVTSAERNLGAARAQGANAGGALLPSLSAFAQERWTNAAGFGPDWLWSAGIQARWNLDLTRPADLESRAAATSRAELELERARQAAGTRIHDAWHNVRTLTLRATAARSAETASTRGASVARARLEAGTGSALEVSQAERDRFDAVVSRIRADADLHVARRELRLAAGFPPELEVTP